MQKEIDLEEYYIFLNRYLIEVTDKKYNTVAAKYMELDGQRLKMRIEYKNGNPQIVFVLPTSIDFANSVKELIKSKEHVELL